MSDPLLVFVFVVAALVSLGTSWLLVSRLERVGAALGLTEALLGMLAALAADAPEITAAVTALVGHQSRIGAGVVIGSNVFNIAALLGLAAVIAGRVTLHRRVVLLEGAVAVFVAASCVAVIAGGLPAAAGLAIVLAVLIPYVLILGSGPDRLRRSALPARISGWLARAVAEEELELEEAIAPPRGQRRDGVLAAAATVVVIAASIAMEQSASKFGSRYSIDETVIGGLLLAAVTSMPNAVAAVYLAQRGRGAATLSTAMNSNALNVSVGLLLPASIVGLGATSNAGALVALWYLGLTLLALGFAYAGSGLVRAEGAAIICAYVTFAVLVLTRSYSSGAGLALGTGLPALIGAGIWAHRAAGRGRAQRAAAAGP